MSRPRSDARRQALLTAASRVIASQGLGATTAAIAKEAGVSNGALFLYFETKADLVNELFVALKTEMGRAGLDGLPAVAQPREQLLHMWTHWLKWATSHPDSRRALAQLQVSDVITPRSHEAVGSASRAIADLLERARTGGPVRDAPLGFVLALTNAIADTAVDAMLHNPQGADALSAVAFQALWCVLAGQPSPAPPEPSPKHSARRTPPRRSQEVSP